MNDANGIRLYPAKRPILGTTVVPSDKSVTHRRLLIAAINHVENQILLQSPANDVFSTITALQALGIHLHLTTQQYKTKVIVPAKKRFVSPAHPIDCQNSGTTARLLCGLLCSQNVTVQLIGDDSLTKRPMERVAIPLQKMGAKITTSNGTLPIHIQPASLHGISYPLPVASAQVKSAILLAGLFADGITTVIERFQTRDHTERLLQIAPQTVGDGTALQIDHNIHLPDCSGEVPLDISNLAFWIAAAILVNGSCLEWKNVLLNPTRIAYLKLLKAQGAHLDWEVTHTQLGEPIGWLEVRSGGNFHFRIDSELLPLVIDEIPILAVLAAATQGSFELHSAKELRTKESDRIKSIVDNLRRMNIEVEEYLDGFQFEAKDPLRGAKLSSFQDHRIAMAFAVAALVAKGETWIQDAQVASVSDRIFFEQLFLYLR
ncbi:MAG: 3-phosphoshikimate 1-carboxyvinyltransferase [bacterium]|nr:3-phosphoshikimate 1-carboxyvinyltransferase [bacterium]